MGAKSQMLEKVTKMPKNMLEKVTKKCIFILEKVKYAV